MSFEAKVEKMKKYVWEEMPKLSQHETEVPQTLNSLQVGAISGIAREMPDYVFTALCIQLYGTKREFDDEKGKCSYSKYKDMNDYYTVESALYRGIFWETLQLLGDKLEELEKDDEEEQPEKLDDKK